MNNKLHLSQIKLILISFFIITNSIDLLSQSKLIYDKNYIPTLNRSLAENEIFRPPQMTKKPGHYSTEDWKEVIDSVWGPGLPTAQKLEIFDTAWDTINAKYAAFQNLDVNIDSLRDLYRPEIENGISRGRFAAIMSHLSLAMKECHTVILDVPVSWGTPITPGVPLFVIGPWYNNERFGASLTPLADSSLLVYRALDNHQLGIVKGDIVLGYNGILWKELYKELLTAQLPISLNWVWGSNDKSITHCILSSAGLNWHLFDTIDIVKYETGDTLHLPTSLLNNQSGTIWGNEQLDVLGVEWPNLFQDDYVSWGIIDGTQIGYIYVTSWDYNPQYGISQQFYNAIDSLMHHHQTTGMIMDFRLNYGGGGTSNQGFSLLFNSTFNTLSFDVRCGDPNNHFSMCPHPFLNQYVFRINGNPNSYYDKPIAVLTGPGTVSAGDVESVRLKFHPKVEFFGKPSSGAFCSASYPDLGHNDWFFYLSTGNAYFISNHQYLAHTELDMYEEIWLTQPGVVNNKDDVVEAAIQWISNTSSADKNNAEIVSDYCLNNNYPNPFNPSTTICYSIPILSLVTLKIYDVLGNEIVTLVNEEKSTGNYEVEFDGTGLSSGIYFYKLLAGRFVKTKKMLLIK
ncbi:MAG: S41 family peptidase [Ignavibacteriaceae bacterium]